MALASPQPMRPPTAPEAQPPAQGCPLDPKGDTTGGTKGEPSRRGCRRGAAAALRCLPKVAHAAAFERPGVPLEDFDLDVGDVAAYAKEQLPGGEAAAVQRAARQARVPRRHYEAWLDYVYYSSGGLRLVAYQEPLTEEQAQLVYKDGDALPNAWHPSDHLPVGCVFELL